ncbi:MAG: Gfo/Idh/MocA family oxidoreductase [Hungatella sp.]|jgi:predicted dehydrogenase|nr:Gfo/Idh/MocA family oxidoreductase [Hungatella sp.]
MTDNKLVLAYIGNGKSANRYHIPYVLQRQDNFTVKTIFSPRIHHDVWARLDGVYYTENPEDVFGDPEIDLVVVSTQMSLHYEYTKRALESGKHCLCEKPFMETKAQAQELFDLAEKKGLYCSAYQNRRYDSDFLTVQKVIESGMLGELLEVEMHYDYYRPEVPERAVFSPYSSYLYGHGCHTLDQVISYFGKPNGIRYDVRQLLGQGRMNDYFDIDLYYKTMKVSVKSSYFRVKSRPRFVVYGKRGMFVKETEDRQEEHLKLFYMPGQPRFGLDEPRHYGVLTYYDQDGGFHEEKVSSLAGDYGRVYDDIYECIVNGKEPVIKSWQTLFQMEMLEEGIRNLR